MRYRSVLGLSPRRSAALPAPLIFQRHAWSAARICARSMSSRLLVCSIRWQPRNVHQWFVQTQRCPRRQDHRAFDHILQLPNVARPIVFDQRLHDVCWDAVDGFAQTSLLLGDEMPDQQRNVVAPQSKRRDLNRKDGQPIVEIWAEAVCFHRMPQVTVGCGHDADVDFASFCRADSLKFAFLEHSQQFRLQFGIEFADFVQEERASIGQLEIARSCSPRPR